MNVSFGGKSMISPTGSLEVRGSDKHGSGAFKSGRSSRPHYGVDLVSLPGQSIVAPHSGIIKRSIIVYPNTQKYKGLEVIGDECISHLYYITPKPGIVGQEVKQGDVIGFTQDISEKYEGITIHIHWQIFYNPILFL